MPTVFALNRTEQALQIIGGVSSGFGMSEATGKALG